MPESRFSLGHLDSRGIPNSGQTVIELAAVNQSVLIAYLVEPVLRIGSGKVPRDLCVFSAKGGADG
jgi:hypothetical protein